VQSTSASGWRPVGTVLATSTSIMLTLADLNLTGPRTISFLVKSAALGVGDTLFSEASNIAVAVWNNGGGMDMLRFTSKPIREATEGALYSYQAVAVSNDSAAVITYALIQGPNGMTVDSTSGLVTWTPAQQGVFDVVLGAKDNHGNTARQDYALFVDENEHQSGNVSGQITDSVTGNAIANAEVTFMLLDSISPFSKIITIKTNDSGMFDLFLPIGVYSVRAEAEGYVTTYYGNTDSLPGTLLTILLNQADTVNIKMRPAPRGTLVGKVTNAITGAPINDATITAIFKGKSRDSIGMQFPGYGLLYIAQTDDSGNYSLRLPPGAYIVRADAKGYTGEWYIATDSVNAAQVVTVTADSTDTANFRLQPITTMRRCSISGMVTNEKGSAVAGAKVKITFVDRDDRDDDSTFSETVLTDSTGHYYDSVMCGESYIVSARADGFIGLFWKNRHNPLDADRVHVEGNVTDVDFVLVQDSSSGTELSGTVYGCDSVLSMVPSHIVAFLVIRGRFVAVAGTETDSNGFYTLQNISAGTYVIEAIPENHNYAPGYYTDRNQCTMDWHAAKQIQLLDSAQISGLDVYLHPAKRCHGYAHIHGHVHIETGGGISGNGTLNGVLVLLYDSNGDLDDYAVTDSLGNFDIADVTTGTFTLTVDIVNFTCISQNTVITDYDANDNPSTEIAMILDNTAAVNEPNTVLPLTANLSQNYPNPFNPATTIDFTLPTEDKVTLTVYSLTGEKVATLINGETRAAGTYHVAFDMPTLPNGTYIYRLQTSTGVITKKMVELR
ncbi:MAG TPA: carboxypeptidase regulatory-like domain-containing protein, partial [Candidatus Kapabacteria bacterium]|nr:carboxypeptidase regulatory-like domain-containing protein [Candidatus Kapabacteria bacterium]